MMLMQVYRSVAGILSVISGTGLLIMMVLTSVDVVGRYCFNRSIFGTAEYVEILMAITIFGGVAFVSATNDHITVSIFEGWVNTHFPKLQRWTVMLFALGIYILITYQLFRLGFSSLESGRRMAALELPQWIIPMSAAVMSLFGIGLSVVAIILTCGRVEILREDHNEPDASEKSKGIE
jgi:TRAP-type transport system small permease protein